MSPERLFRYQVDGFIVSTVRVGDVPGRWWLDNWLRGTEHTRDVFSFDAGGRLCMHGLPLVLDDVIVRWRGQRGRLGRVNVVSRNVFDRLYEPVDRDESDTASDPVRKAPEVVIEPPACSDVDREIFFGQDVGVFGTWPLVTERYSCRRGYPEPLMPKRVISVDRLSVTLDYQRPDDPETKLFLARMFEHIPDLVEDFIRGFDVDNAGVDGKPSHVDSSVVVPEPGPLGDVSTVSEADGVGPQRFRKRPLVVEAMRIPPEVRSVGDILGRREVERWLTAELGAPVVGSTPLVPGKGQWATDRDDTLLIGTLEGAMSAQPGDWIVRGIAGEFYPVKPDVFAATYEPDNGGVG